MERIFYTLVPILSFVLLLPREYNPADGKSTQYPPLVLTGSNQTTMRRAMCIVTILLSFVVSHNEHSHRIICPTAPGFNATEDCLRFVGWFTFTSYTRWSFLLIGVSLFLAEWGPSNKSHSLEKGYLVLSQIACANALMVTFVSYTVLVPLALLHPDNPASPIVLSFSGHIMHIANSVMCVLEWRFLHEIPFVADSAFHITMPTAPGTLLHTTISNSLRQKLYFDTTYLIFELLLYHNFGIIHYPFLDPTYESTIFSLPVLIVISMILWAVCRRVMLRLLSSKSNGNTKVE